MGDYEKGRTAIRNSRLDDLCVLNLFLALLSEEKERCADEAGHNHEVYVITCSEEHAMHHQHVEGLTVCWKLRDKCMWNDTNDTGEELKKVLKEEIQCLMSEEEQ